MRQSDDEERCEERCSEEGGCEAGAGVEMWWHYALYLSPIVVPVFFAVLEEGEGLASSSRATGFTEMQEEWIVRAG